MKIICKVCGCLYDGDDDKTPYHIYPPEYGGKGELCAGANMEGDMYEDVNNPCANCGDYLYDYGEFSCSHCTRIKEDEELSDAELADRYDMSAPGPMPPSTDPIWEGINGRRRK
jgi:hypothetical protein